MADIERFRAQAIGTIRVAPFLVLGCSIVFLFSKGQFVQSIPYEVTAAIAGVVSFPILWMYWRKGNMGLFFLLIFGGVAVHHIAQNVFLPLNTRHPVSWALAQFFAIYFIALFSLVFIFRDRMRTMLMDENRHRS